MARVVERIVFDKERKLIARHEYVGYAVNASKKTVLELLSDPFGGWAYLIQALVIPGATEAISLKKASELLDHYFDAGGSHETLHNAMSRVLAAYINAEVTPTKDEGDAPPNAPGPATTGLASD